MNSQMNSQKKKKKEKQRVTKILVILFGMCWCVSVFFFFFFFFGFLLLLLLLLLLVLLFETFLRRFVSAGFELEACQKASEANRSTEMMSKTAVKGGKLRSCEHLLFECGRSFELFSNENPWLWLLAAIMVVATPLQSLSVSQESWL